MNPNITDLAVHSTLTELVAAWRQAEADMRQAHAQLFGAIDSLKTSLGGNRYNFYLTGRHHLGDFDDIEKFVLSAKRDAWKVLVNRMEIRRFLSIKAAEDLDKMLEGNDLPDITEEAVLSMMGAAYQNIGNFTNEAVAEVFDFLRPRNGKYKSNRELGLGKKVIISYGVSLKWGGGFRVNDHRSKQLRALDNVFHMLAGNGMPKEYQGPLIDAIDATGPDGVAETEFFKLRCCKNLNLHIEFKRLDLVTELNRIAGERVLRPTA